VVSKVRERLVVSKQTTYTVHMEKFNIKKLNEVEGRKQYRVEILNRFATLENFDTEVNIIELGKLLDRIQKIQSKRV
jgi:hypothetical protein